MVENNNNLPIWTILTLVSGCMVFVGLFTDIIGLEYGPFDSVIHYAAAAMMNMDIFNGSKYFVIVIGVLALALIIYAIHSMYTIRAGKKMEKAKIIVGITSALIMIVALTFIILVMTGNVYNGNFEGVTAHAGGGLWLMFVGAIPALIGIALQSRE